MPVILVLAHIIHKVVASSHIYGTILVNISNMVQKCLSKQMDIDKILKIIQRKFLTQSLPLDPAWQLNILWCNGHSFCMYGTQITVQK